MRDELESLRVEGWIEICLKSQLLERKLELQHLGKMVKGPVKEHVFDGVPGLLKAFARASTEGASSTSEVKKGQ